MKRTLATTLVLFFPFALALSTAACGGTSIGTPGEPGAPGTPGKDGHDGTPALLDASHVYAVTHAVPLYSSGFVTANCEAHDIALGGGCALDGVAPDAWLTVDAPSFSDTYEGWTCGGWATKPSTVDVGPHILTASLSCYRVSK